MKYLGIILLIIVIIVLTALCDKWFFETVMATEWPDWVKYVFLRR